MDDGSAINDQTHPNAALSTSLMRSYAIKIFIFHQCFIFTIYKND